MPLATEPAPAPEAVRDASDSDDLDLCIANPWFYPVLVGPGERFRRYAPGLRERGIRMRVCTVQHPGLASRDTVDGIPIQRVAVGRRSRWRERTFVYRLSFLENGARPDVFQVFSSSWIVPLVVMLKSLGVPTLLVFTLLGARHRSRLRRELNRVYRRWRLQPFDCVVTSSGVMTRELEELGLSRVETIPNGVDLLRFRPPRSYGERTGLRRRLGIPIDADVVLFVGSILPRKRVDMLLRAWHRVGAARPGATLVLVGPQHEDQAKYAAFRTEVGRLAAEAPDPGRVIFAGAVPEVEEYMRAADVLVFPSQREGMPNVVPEAMASGLPCILTPFAGLPDEFGRRGREYELVDPAPDALAAAILEHLKNPLLRGVRGAQARRWVETNLDMEVSLDRFAALYRQLAGRA